jgi:hypothetical protein
MARIRRDTMQLHPRVVTAVIAEHEGDLARRLEQRRARGDRFRAVDGLASTN